MRKKMVNMYSGGCDHIHTHADNEPFDIHICHCSVCKRVTGQDTTHIVLFNYVDLAVENLEGLNHQPFNDQNSDGPLILCKCADCGMPIMIDDKQRRVRAIVPNLMGYDETRLPATYHAFYDFARSAPKSVDGLPAYEGFPPDFSLPDPA